MTRPTRYRTLSSFAATTQSTGIAGWTVECESPASCEGDLEKTVPEKYGATNKVKKNRKSASRSLSNKKNGVERYKCLTNVTEKL